MIDCTCDCQCFDWPRSLVNQQKEANNKNFLKIENLMVSFVFFFLFRALDRAVCQGVPRTSPGGQLYRGL